MTARASGDRAVPPERPGWSPTERRDSAHVASVVREWIEACDSPLYVSLALACSEDPEMLALISRIDNVPPMNLLFGAVKLAVGPDDALAVWYPHLVGGGARTPSADAFRAFRDFALERADFVVTVGRTRRTQTNEVGRAAAILPWIASEAQRIAADAGLEPDAPVHLVDVGASAGLNLCLDRFDVDYGGGTLMEAINLASTRVTLDCENRGGFPLPASAPVVGKRIGLDLAPVDATDPEQAAWLEALVWPEHQDRLERLRAAIEIRRETDVAMIGGDAVATLRELDSTLPPGPVVVFHTVMAYQLSLEQRAGLDDAVAKLSQRRPVARVSMEPLELTKRPQIRVGLRLEDAPVVARAHAHGRWLEQP